MTQMSWAYIAELLDRTAEKGFISIYVGVDPTGSDEWRIAVRNELDRLCEEQDARAHRQAFLATIERIKLELHDRVGRLSGRGLVAFVEVGEKQGTDIWLPLQLPVPTVVHYNVRPYVGPLAQVLDDSSRTGIVCASTEYISMFEWDLGELTELLNLEFRHDIDEWQRIEGGQRGGKPSQAHITSQGEQFLKKLALEREDFLHRVVSPTVAEWATMNGWERIVAFGPSSFRDDMRTLCNNSAGLRYIEGGELNLAHEPRPRLLDRLRPLLETDNREREKELVTSAISRAQADQAGALGREQLEAMLEQRRVRHLLVAGPLSLDTNGGGASIERLIAEAIRSGGKVTPVEGEAAAMLRPVGGVAALLHY